MARIALIEDDKPIQELYRLTLEAMGHEVDIANNGLQGLEMLEQFQPQVILLDIMMPVMDGYEFLRQATHRNIIKPTIVLTNLSLDDVRHLKDHKDVVDIFVKVETTPSLVADRVNQLLG